MKRRDVYPEVASNLPDVETPRLLLRRFRKADAVGLGAVFAKPEVWMYPYGRGFSAKETERFLEVQIAEWNEGGFGCWIAIEKTSNMVIGYVGLSVPHFLPSILPAVEVGWRFDPDFWGNGFAAEGASAALDQAFGTLKLDRVCSAPQSINPPSSKVCKRLGMRFERVVTAEATKTRGPVEVDLYWITAAEWNERDSVK
ncbi:MAG: GNAT family N-acetyltransferase [Pseudomonadota bacterium]